MPKRYVSSPFRPVLSLRASPATHTSMLLALGEEEGGRRENRCSSIRLSALSSRTHNDRDQGKGGRARGRRQDGRR